MQITVNNKPRQLDSALTVEELLEADKVPGAGTAVAVNGKLVPRVQWADRLLTGDESVLIITAAYGG